MSPTPFLVSVGMPAQRQVLPLKSEVISSLRSSLSTPSLPQCIEELVFNSLDAKATCIAVRVDLENYRIQVVDNGCGISSEDLLLVGQRNNTSKCYGLEDLNTLAFFGFRGEFLASLSNISSVLEVISRPKHTNTTFGKIFQKGEIYEVGEAREKRPAHGTTVTAYNVFYNLPVRQKSINIALDLERIRKRLEAFAIIHHHVSFSLRDDLSGSKIFQTHTTLSPKSAFGFLFGHPKATTLKEITNSHKKFMVIGYVGTEGHGNKNHQYIYVNKQLVLKTKLHKVVNHFLSRSLLLKSQRLGKYPDSPLISDQLSHCQQSSPARGQGEHAIFILDITCLRSEYDIQYDNHQTFLEFQDWKGVSTCVEQALQQFLVNENLFLISEEEKCTKKNDELQIEDSGEDSSSENEEAPSQPHPAQLAKLQKYGYNISTRNCTNNIQSRVVTRAHLRVKKTKEKKDNVDRNSHKESENLEEAPNISTNNSEGDGSHSTTLLPLNNDNESLTCNTKQIHQREDEMKKNLPQNNEDGDLRKALKQKEVANSEDRVDGGCKHMNPDIFEEASCMGEIQDTVEESDGLEIHQQKTMPSEVLSKPFGKNETNKQQAFDDVESRFVSQRDGIVNKHGQRDPQSSTSNKSLSAVSLKPSDSSFISKDIFHEEDVLLHVGGQLCKENTVTEEEKDSSVVIPDVSSYNNSNVQGEGESIPVMMPSCASTLPAERENGLKVSEDSCQDKQGQETLHLPQNASVYDGYNKILNVGGRKTLKTSSGKVSDTPAPEVTASLDSKSGSYSRKGPLKCGPVISPTGRSTMVTAIHENMISATNKNEACSGVEEFGRITEDYFQLNKEKTIQESVSSLHNETEAEEDEVNEEDVSMVTSDACSQKRDMKSHCGKSVHFQSFKALGGDNVHEVPGKRERSATGFGGVDRKLARKESPQDQSPSFQIQETGTYTSSLQRFKEGLKSRPVNVATNLATKISEALNKSSTKSAVFGTNIRDKQTTSHLSRMRSHWFPVTENNLPLDIRDAPSIRLSQKLAWLRKCKPKEMSDNFTKLKDDSPSLEQSLVKNFYNERKPLSGIQRKAIIGDKEMATCDRRPKQDEIPLHYDESISHSFIPSRISAEQVKRKDTFVEESHLPHKIQKCSPTDAASLSGRCNPCHSSPKKSTKAPAFDTFQHIKSGHCTFENCDDTFFDRGSIAQTRTDNYSMNRAPLQGFEVKGELQDKPWVENTNATKNVTPLVGVCTRKFMSTESFIQTARDLLPYSNPSNVKVTEDSCTANNSTTIVNTRGISQEAFVSTLQCDVCIDNDQQKHLDGEFNISGNDRELAESYIAQKCSSEAATSKDDDNLSSDGMCSCDVKAISEARHKEILSMIDNPPLISPEVEVQISSDTHSLEIGESDDKVAFTHCKDSTGEEMLSTQPFCIQSNPVEENKDPQRPNETCSQVISQEEDGCVELEDMPCESSKTSHANPSEPFEVQIVESEKDFDGRFSDIWPADIQEEESNSVKEKLAWEENSKSSPGDMGMNWDMFNKENIDMLTTSDKTPKPQVPQIRNYAEDKFVPLYSRGYQFKTSHEVVPDHTGCANPQQDQKATSLQGGLSKPGVDIAEKDGSKGNEKSEVSTKVIIAKDHTIVLQRTSLEHHLQRDECIATSFNEFNTTGPHLERSKEKVARAGADQKEYKQPDEQNPSREGVDQACDADVSLTTNVGCQAQPCGADVSSSTDAQGLSSTLKSCAKAKGSDPVPWELYWFLPKTAKPFFPRLHQDRHPVVNELATPESKQLLDELLMEENETLNFQSKWKHGMPNIDKDACRSFDELFDKWQNPVFKTDTDIPDSSATRSISATVKVHNSLHPYQFTKEIFKSIEVIGQLDKKFIVCLVSTSIQRQTEIKPHLLAVIDQHAAHERIRLEQLTQDAYLDPDDGSDSEDITSPYLQDTSLPHLRSCRVIPPISINMSDEECRLAQAFSQKLKRFGVTVNITKSGKEFKSEVTELPACMVEREANMVKKARQTVAADLAEALVQESIQQLQDTGGSFASLPSTITKILNSQACRGAIKFGDPLPLHNILSLLHQLSQCKLPFQCAHGRPSIIPLLDFNHLTAKLHSQDPHSHRPKVNLQRFRRKIIKMVGNETKS